jgi:hypothetical protein
MNHLENAGISKKISSLVLALGVLVFLTGCEEANLALDNLLGRPSTVATPVWPDVSASSSHLALKREPGEKPPAQTPPATQEAAPRAEEPQGKKEEPPQAAPGKKKDVGDRPPQSKVVTPETVPAPAVPPPKPAPPIAEGKKREPGERAPGMAPAPGVAAEEIPKRDLFRVPRDPFKQPTEILPSECPPSMPLCRFDHSQLKLVGVMQVSDGQFKGLVEDPDGRGYFITPGTRIGGATVTQVTNQGATLFLSKTRQDVPMPLFQAVRETAE